MTWTLTSLLLRATVNPLTCYRRPIILDSVLLLRTTLTAHFDEQYTSMYYSLTMHDCKSAWWHHHHCTIMMMSSCALGFFLTTSRSSSLRVHPLYQYIYIYWWVINRLQMETMSLRVKHTASSGILLTPQIVYFFFTDSFWGLHFTWQESFWKKNTFAVH